jgi:hypothetical protein
VAVVRTDFSEEPIASIIMVKGIIGLGTTLAVTRNRSTLRKMLLQSLVTANVVPSSMIPFTLMMEAVLSSKKSVLTTATRRDISEHGILQSHRRENLKCYIALTGWSL